jgi:hypothetical protein
MLIECFSLLHCCCCCSVLSAQSALTSSQQSVVSWRLALALAHGCAAAAAGNTGAPWRTSMRIRTKAVVEAAVAAGVLAGGRVYKPQRTAANSDS